MSTSNLSTIRLVAIILIVVVVLAMVFLPTVAAAVSPLPWIALALAVVGAIWSHLKLQKQ